MTATADVISVEVPDIGDFSDVPIIEILVGPGDTVAVDDPLVTLESDKATMDVPAPAAGTVKEVLVELGDKVSQGAALLKLQPAGNGDPPAARRAAGAGVGAARRAGSASASAPPVEQAPAPPPAQPAPPPANGGDPPPARSASGLADDGPGRIHPAVYASPSVRRLARERGIDLSAVAGSGRKGRITKADVERATGAHGHRSARGWR